MNHLVLSTFLAIGSPDGYTMPDDQAARYAAKAFYKHMEWDRHVNRLEKRYLSKDLKKYGGYVILVTRVATEQRVSYTWRF